jgi:hypothetical protein
VRVLRAAKASGLRPARALFAAAWRWLTADPAHVPHLEEMLCQVAAPDLSVEDLLSVAGLAGGAAAAAAPAVRQLLAARAAAAPPAAAAPAAPPASAPPASAAPPAATLALASAPPASGAGIPLPLGLQVKPAPQPLQALSALLQGPAGAGLSAGQVAAVLSAAAGRRLAPAALPLAALAVQPPAAAAHAVAPADANAAAALALGGGVPFAGADALGAPGVPGLPSALAPPMTSQGPLVRGGTRGCRAGGAGLSARPPPPARTPALLRRSLRSPGAPLSTPRSPPPARPVPPDCAHLADHQGHLPSRRVPHGPQRVSGRRAHRAGRRPPATERASARRAPCRPFLPASFTTLTRAS